MHNPEIKVGDRVFGPDGHEWKIIAIGGKDKNVLHCERPVFKKFRAEDVRPSAVAR